MTCSCFRVTGSNFSWAQSQTILNGVSADQVVFYFVNATTSPAIDVNKSSTDFSGTIFAPTSSVIYHNPATFTGRIIAENIDVHSDFNITTPPSAVPEPSYVPFLCIGFAAIVVLRRRRSPENVDAK